MAKLHSYFTKDALRGDVRTSMFVTNSVSTTDATVTTLQIIPIDANRTYLLESYVVARRTGGAAGTANDGGAYIRRAMVTTKVGVVTINAVQDDFTQEDQAGWDVTYDVSGTNVRIRVTGAINNDINWFASTLTRVVG